MNAMKSNFKFNEIFLILKSGITGALALTSICIILFFIGFTVREPFVSYLYSKTFAKCSLEGLFIATGGIGFVLGLIVRQRFPIIQRSTAPMVVAAIPLIIIGWLFNGYAMRVSTPREMKLADCTNSTEYIHFKAPKGHNFQLVFSSTATLSGHVRVIDETSKTIDFPINSNQIEEQFNFFRPQKDYDVQITFDQSPPSSTSLWLHWMEARIDM
jgi:hypothetical protein